MSIKKSLRNEVYNKFGGKCAYSGTDLKEDWQIDHLVPKTLFETVYRNKLRFVEAPNDVDHIDNLMPVQRIINHYKRSLLLEDFRNWYLGELHERLKKLPKNPRVEKSIRHKEYLLEVAELFGITPEKPFDRIFYFEKLQEKNNESQS